MTITKQEVFDRSLVHLREQGQPALEEGTKTNCFYRTSEGLKCAIGALISDEDYFKDLEGQAASAKSVYSLFDGNPSDYIFYGTLQSALHDGISDFSDFPKALEEAAKNFAYHNRLDYKL